MFRPFKVYPPKKMVKGGHAANPLNMGSVLFVWGFSLNRNCCLGNRKRQCFNGDVLECLCFKLIPTNYKLQNTTSNKITAFWHKSLVATPVASMKSHADSHFCWCKSTKLYIPNVLDIVPERYLDAPILVKLRKFLSNFLSGVYIYCWFKKELRGSLYSITTATCLFTKRLNVSCVFVFCLCFQTLTVRKTHETSSYIFRGIVGHRGACRQTTCWSDVTPHPP